MLFQWSFVPAAGSRSGSVDGSGSGDGAWLAQNVVVLSGVTIGAGAVVGANSVVRDDIPPGAVAVGAPARVVRRGPRTEVAG